MEDFPGNLPGNSHSARIKKEQQAAEETTEAPESKDEAAEVPQVKKVVTGKVVTRKKSLAKSFKEVFVSENEQTFPEYLIQDVAIPMIRELAIKMVKQTLDGISNGVEDRIAGVTGAAPRTTTSYGTGRAHTNYNAPYRSTPTRTTARTSPPPPPRVSIRRSNRVEDIFLETREDGLNIIEELEGKIDGFGHCTVADLYASVGLDIKTTDESWGWDTLEGARVRHHGTGVYQLIVPRPIPINFEN